MGRKISQGANLGRDAGGGITSPTVSQPFAPTDIANMFIWLDPSDASTLTMSGGDVTAIADKTTNGNNFTADDGKRPTITANHFNSSKAALTFDGTQTIYRSSVQLPAYITVIMIVDALGGSAGPGCPMFHGVGSMPGTAGFQWYTDSASWYVARGGVENSDTFIWAPTTKKSICMTYGATEQSIYVNNVVAGPGTQTGTVHSNINLTAVLSFMSLNNGANLLISGKVGFIGLWTRQLTSAERAQIQTYLVSRYGI